MISSLSKLLLEFPTGPAGRVPQVMSETKQDDQGATMSVWSIVRYGLNRKGGVDDLWRKS